MRRGGLRLDQLRARLERLRDSCQYLEMHAGLGREMRESIVAAGSRTWRPAEDLVWREWIAREGDEYARLLLQALDDEFEKRAARIEAASKIELGARTAGGEARDG